MPTLSKLPRTVEIVDKAFHWSNVKKHWGLLPTVFFMGCSMALAGGYITYAAVTKPDLSWKPSTWLHAAPYSDVKSDQVHKLYDVRGGRFTTDKEVIALRREIRDHYIKNPPQ